MYDKDHCWQYDVRIRNKERDLLMTGLDEEEVRNMRISDFSFSHVDKSYFPEIKKFIEEYEWMRTIPPYPTHYFIARYDGILAGALIFSMPNAFSKLLGPETKNLERLIARGACISWSPKNLASSFIMWSIKWMVSNTQYRLFTAYADPEAKELGTIYQACNFWYIGQTSGRTKKYKEPDSDKWISDRKFRNVSSYKKYAKELGISWKSDWSVNRSMKWDKMPDSVEETLKSYGKKKMNECETKKVPPKHKYVYILGKDKKETRELKDKFKRLNPKLVGLQYPKYRGK